MAEAWHSVDSARKMDNWEQKECLQIMSIREDIMDIKKYTQPGSPMIKMVRPTRRWPLYPVSDAVLESFFKNVQTIFR